MDPGDSLSSVGPVKLSPDGSFKEPGWLIFLGRAEGNEPEWLIFIGPTEKPGPQRPHDERGAGASRDEQGRAGTSRDEQGRGERHTAGFPGVPLDPSDLKHLRI